MGRLEVRNPGGWKLGTQEEENKWIFPCIYHTNNVEIQEAVENMEKGKYHEKAFCISKKICWKT